jgi:AraC-like DNA-binding protein
MDMNKLLIWEAAPDLKLVVFNHQAGRPPPSDRASYSSHSHSFYELGLVLKGGCTWHLGRRSFALRAGQAILVRPQSRHREEGAPDLETELAWIGFDFSGISPAWAERVLSLGDDFHEVALLFHAIYREHSLSDPLTRKRVSLALQNVLVLVSRRVVGAKSQSAHRKPARPKSRLNARQIRSLESAAHYFRHNFQDPLSIAQVAAYHSFCPAYFSTLFRIHYQMPPRTFLRQVKLQKAEELLTTSDLTLKEISARCDFVDAAHLTKAFKQRYGVPPGAYRSARQNA